jgi:hypothetical protein
VRIGWARCIGLSHDIWHRHTIDESGAGEVLRALADAWAKSIDARSSSAAKQPYSSIDTNP